MRNPCLDCQRLGEDKNDAACVHCERRQAYVASLGGMTHSVPDAMMDIRRYRKRMDEMAEPTSRQAAFSPCIARKRCPACGKDLEISSACFMPSRKTKDGFMHICRDCQRQKISRGRADHKRLKSKAAPGRSVAPTEAPSGKKSEKVCRRCKKPLPIDRFIPNSMSKDGYQHICMDCFKNTFNKTTNAGGRLLLKLDFEKYPHIYEALQA